MSDYHLSELFTNACCRKAQWPAEDSSDERKRRHAVAKAAAVEGADITIASTSKIEVDPFNCRASRIGRTLIAADSSRLAPLFVAQVSHPADKRTRLNPHSNGTRRNCVK